MYPEPIHESMYSSLRGALTVICEGLGLLIWLLGICAFLGVLWPNT
jgi:hypothetical protein